MTAAYVAGTPTGRLLQLLERVQERPGITGPRLATELGVTERTVRRYVASLQGLGIPVEPARGRIGGYRLRPGYRMPPLMLSTEEAVAATLALAVMSRPGEETVDQCPTGESASVGASAAETSPVESALGKLLRVLPRDVAGRVDDVLSAVTRPAGGWSVAGPVPDPGVLTALAAGVVRGRRCRLRHRSQTGDVTVREVNPYGVAVVQGGRGWYLHAWCHLRRARRTFRVDRIDRVDVLATTFTSPARLDIVAAVEESLALARPEWAVTMLFEGPVSDVAQWIPRHLGVCEAVDAQTTRVRSSTSNLDYFVLRISDHPFRMTVLEPPELRQAFGRHAERMHATAHGYAFTHD
jgi:predicted DNA-binding transcriptional regulator YafY